MALHFELAGAQIDGARDYQEDAFLITNLVDAKGNPSALIIVADGMGGHAAGNVASNMAVQAFNKSVTANYPSDSLSDVLNESILKANASITETIKETPALEGMGCTMVAAVLENDKIWWASVGDSHIYLLRDRELSKINADHSYGGFLDRMAAAGTPIDAEPGLSRNMLMSAVTGSDIAEIDCPPEPLQLKHGDKILICSDGMDTLSSGKIIQYADWSDTPKEAAEALLNAVEEAAMPKQDNTTIVIANIVDTNVAAVDKPAEPEEEDEEDDGDITTPGAAQKQEEEVHEEVVLETETETEPVPEPEPMPEPQEPPPSPPPPMPEPAAIPAEPAAPAGEKKANTGLYIGIAAGIILVIGIAGFFMFSGKKSTPSTPETEQLAEAEETMEAGETEAEIDIEEEEVPVETVAEAETEVDTKETGETPEPEETVKAETTEEKVAQETKPAKTEEKPVKTAESKKEFQDSLKSGAKGPVMISLPGGSYEMGSPGTSGNIDERPRHKVTIKPFAISKYEVTFAEYDIFAKATGRKLPDNLYMDRKIHPVIFVSWDDAYYYVKWLSEQTGKNYRLPSESEWEYAASAATGTPFWWGFKEDPGKAHCFGCETGLDPRKPAKVGNFKPNPFGIYDTSGNVAEWVRDCWHDNYNDAPSDNSVWEGGDCAYRVVRGGSFSSPPQSIRSTKRDKLKSDSSYDHVGIRIARDLE